MAGWKIVFDGHTLRESELTIAQAEKIESLTDTTWRFIHPTYSAKHARAILAVMYADRTASTYDDVAEKIGGITVDGFAEMVQEDEDDLPAVYEDGIPQVADGTSTAT